jgi:hypothetical protein
MQFAPPDGIAILRLGKLDFIHGAFPQPPRLKKNPRFRENYLFV